MFWNATNVENKCECVSETTPIKYQNAGITSRLAKGYSHTSTHWKAIRCICCKLSTFDTVAKSKQDTHLNPSRSLCTWKSNQLNLPKWMIIFPIAHKETQQIPYQLGFKRKYGTDLCNFVLKESIRSYAQKGSNVFACFLDASKEFDWVNCGTLHRTLQKRQIPIWAVIVT